LPGCAACLAAHATELGWARRIADEAQARRGGRSAVCLRHSVGPVHAEVTHDGVKSAGLIVLD
jgi:hypothetical protein